jgi:hypothetical protein
MAAFVIALTEEEQRLVNAERDSHPEAHVRRKMLVVWLLHCGLTRSKALTSMTSNAAGAGIALERLPRGSSPAWRTSRLLTRSDEFAADFSPP